MKKEKWHKWFAWHPIVTINDELVWLKKVNRKWVLDAETWCYGGYSGDEAGYIYKVIKK